MKIGIDARMYGVSFTGIGRYTSELIKNLAELDNEHEFTVFMRKEAFDSFAPPNNRFKKVLADYPHYSFGEQFGFSGVIKRENLDLMHFAHFNAPIFYNKPSVVTIHDLTLSFFPGKKHGIALIQRRSKEIPAPSPDSFRRQFLPGRKELITGSHSPLCLRRDRREGICAFAGSRHCDCLIFIILAFS